MTTLKSNINISDFKASGVYFVYQDTTLLPVLNGSSNIKLVIGFSDQSTVFNTPVLLQTRDIKTAREILGVSTKSMERKGSFFNRIVETCLSNSPVLALNLLNVNSETDINGDPTANADLSNYQSFSTDPGNINGNSTPKLYASYYNKEKFWYPDRRNLLATRDVVDNGRILNFTNVGRTPFSVIVRKSDISGYDIPVSEWYVTEDEEIPCFIRSYDLVSDYMIDVILIRGNFSEENYEILSTDPVFGEYFNNSGLIADRIDDFISLPEVNILNIYTGCLIPSFKDKDGTNLYIETLINNDTRRFGLMCSIDTDELDRHETNTNDYFIDLVGHRLLGNNISETDFLSYKKDISEDFTYEQKNNNNSTTANSITGVTIDSFPTYIRVTVANTNPDFINLTNDLKIGTYFNGITTAAGTAAGITISNPILVVRRVTPTTSQLTFELTSDLKENETNNSGSFVDLDLVGSVMTYKTENNRFFVDSNTTYFADPESQAWIDWKAGKITNGDRVNDGTDDHYLKFEIVKDTINRDVLQISFFLDSDLTIPINAGDAFLFGTTYDSQGYLVSGSLLFNIISLDGSINQRFDAVFISDTVVTVDAQLFDDIKIGDYLVGVEDGGDMLTRITSIKRIGTPTVTDLEITCANNIKKFNKTSGGNQIERYKPLETFYTNFNLHYFEGFVLKDTHKPNNTNERMKEIYNVIWNTNIYRGLLNRNTINFRYIVDTFFHGLEFQSKNELSRLALRRQTAVAIINSPKMEEFEKSTDPRFTDSPTPAEPLPPINTAYIRDGGNISENPSFLYTLPEEQQGASYAGYMLPAFIIDDGGDELEVPPSGYVANQFIQKHLDGNPYGTIGGIRRGTIVGNNLKRLSTEFDDEDRGYLGEKGMIPIINLNGSYVIYGDETAYQKFNSVLNNLYVRDTLIEIQLKIEVILQPYIFEYNNDTTQTEVQNLINNLLEPLVNNIGVLSDYQVVFDSSNNTGEIIAQDSAIVDVYLSFNGIIKRFFNRFTLRRSGDGSQSSTGFNPIA